MFSRSNFFGWIDNTTGGTGNEEDGISGGSRSCSSASGFAMVVLCRRQGAWVDARHARRGEGGRPRRDENGGQDLRRGDRTLANRGAPRRHEGPDGKIEGLGKDEGNDEEHAPHRVFPRGSGREKACYRGKGDGGGHRHRQEGSDVQPDGDGGTLRRGHHPGQAGEIRVLGPDRGGRKEGVRQVLAYAQVACPPAGRTRGPENGRNQAALRNWRSPK